MRKVLFAFVVAVIALIVSGCAAGYMEMIKTANKGDMAKAEAMLAEKPAMLMDEDYNGRTALMYAAQGGNLDLVKMLVKKGADVNYQSKANKSTALMWAAEDERDDVIKYLLKKGADVNAVNGVRRNAVHWAALNNATKCLEVLLAAGGDAKARDDQDLSPIQLAVYNGYSGPVNLLMHKGYYDNAAKFTVLLRYIVEGDKKKAVKRISNEGIAQDEVNKTDFMGKTPLMWAVITNQEDIVNELIIAGADINAVDNRGFSPVMWAVNLKQNALLEKLCGRGANPDTQDKGEGKTPLMWAVQDNNPEAVSILLKYRADFSVYDYNSRTALGLADYYGYRPVFKILWNAGARLLAKPEEKAKKKSY